MAQAGSTIKVTFVLLFIAILIVSGCYLYNGFFSVTSFNPLKPQPYLIMDDIVGDEGTVFTGRIHNVLSADEGKPSVFLLNLLYIDDTYIGTHDTIMTSLRGQGQVYESLFDIDAEEYDLQPGEHTVTVKFWSIYADRDWVGHHTLHIPNKDCAPDDYIITSAHWEIMETIAPYVPCNTKSKDRDPGPIMENNGVEFTEATQAIYINQPEEVEELKEGLLRISTEPEGASVLIDGDYVFAKTFTLLKVPNGEHFIELKLDGYEDYNKTVEIIGGKLTDIEQTLVLGETTTAQPNIFIRFWDWIVGFFN